jgi:hypothetical protein
MEYVVKFINYNRPGDNVVEKFDTKLAATLLLNHLAYTRKYQAECYGEKYELELIEQE